ncbi:MAG: cupredoxin domain-containing protein [Anaerolineae bacterium]|nr:cupredoxin domain-containing protein [Anaerolineae bacterium]
MKQVIFILLMATAVLLTACGAKTETTNTKAELSLTATDIAFDTNRLEVKAGEQVHVTLHNEGVLEHDFSIMKMPHTGDVMAEESEHGMGHDMSSMSMEPEIHVAAPTGESLSVEFTPSTPGEYEFFCTVAGHKEAGMVGTLVVK